MILQAIVDFKLDPARWAIVGDKMSDIEAGAAAGLGLRILVASRPCGEFHPMKRSLISTKRSHCCGPALQRLRPISALGASDSTLELAVALGHYHGAKVFARAGVAGGKAGIGSQVGWAPAWQAMLTRAERLAVAAPEKLRSLPRS
jgi:hypothetical protein